MVQTDYLIIADTATAAEGKLYIHGAGWDSLFVPSFPAQHPILGIATRLRVPWEETNQPHNVEVDVVSEVGDSILPEPLGSLRGTIFLGQPAHLPPGSDQALVLAFNITNLQFENPGTYSAVLRIDGRDSATLRFNVTLIPGIPE